LSINNKHTNLVGRSTLLNPWVSHILDSLQLMQFIENKNLSILDMGTGAGFPGAVLSIMGCKDITLIDSNGKKIKFLLSVKKQLNLQTNIVLGRLENIKIKKFDIITSRALAALGTLLTYSQKFIKKNTVLIFLKGKTVNEELNEAKKNWNFDYRKHQSISDSRGVILTIKNISKK
jgi:16S rRNA (guanine527-N7)-methyltransferase